jgi:hypothetical protein
MRGVLFAASLLILGGCAGKSVTTSQTGNGPITTTTSSGASTASTALFTALITGAVTTLGYLNTDIVEWLGLKSTTVKMPPSGTTKAVSQ